MDVDIFKVCFEMFLEEVEIIKQIEFEVFVEKYQNEMEDLQVCYDCQFSNIREDVYCIEQNLLECFSIFIFKFEYF